MKKTLCIILAMMLALAGVAMAEEQSVSITTGLPTDKEPTVMVAQMDNEPGARPQVGIGSADIIYEVELYNGGYTRYTAVFNDTIPDKIEAIRSARIVNADIYYEYRGAFIHYGGQKYEGSNVYNYMASLKKFGVRYDGIGGDKDFYRDNTRKAPNNVICNLHNLWERTDWSSASCKSPLKFYATAKTPATGKDVTEFSIPYRNSYTPSYKWDADSGKYLRFYNDKPFIDGATGEQVAVANVIVQSVDYAWYSGQSDRPKVTTTGTNRCHYFIGGKHFTGYWKRDKVSKNTVYYTDKGKKVKFNPGSTFIQLLKTEKDVEILG